MNLSSIALTVLLCSFSAAEAALKGSHAAGSRFEEKRQLKKQAADVCGPETGTTCVPTLNARSSHKLVDCLKEKFPSGMDTPVTIVEWFYGAYAGQKYPDVYKLTFPQEDFVNFTQANFNAAIGQPRFPAGIFYAESEDEVIEAVICAREAGYKVSPRGRGHSYQGLSSMDGYLVIDMSLMCKPEEFINKTYFDDEPWLLGGGQKAIGSIKSGAGCTNAVMLAYTADTFPDGIYLIGACPTVGITDYATGGGQGDTTPWVGLGIDDVLSYDIVLYDGTFVTANATSHSDLYWALRGGGSGFGVITSLETAVISPPEESSGFSVFYYKYKQTQDEAREFLKRFQDFLVPDLPFGSKKYKEKIRATSAKYGGNANYYTNSSEGHLGFNGMFLGSADEANATFTEAGLLDPEIFNASASFTVEFSTYGEAQLFIVCSTMTSNPWWWPTWTFPSFNINIGVSDVCDDLGIDSTKYCHASDAFWPHAEGWPTRIPNCNPFDEAFNLDDVKDVILPAMHSVAAEPQSWFNRPGAMNFFKAEVLPSSFKIPALRSWAGGLLMGRLEPDVLLELANEGVSVNHFAHGAPTLVARDETGYFGREEFTLLSLGDTTQYEAIASILVNKVYDGDASKLKGFYNYVNPEGNRDWRNYYFGDNYERLSVIKAKYDETNGFGNPVQVEPASLSSKAGKETLFD